MKSLKILAVAALTSLFALSSAADISISGDGRYRLGVKKDAAGDQSNYRNGRMRVTVKGGNAANGVQMRVRTDIGRADVITAGDDKSLSTADDGITTSLRADRRNAWFTLGGIKVEAGELGNYTGLLGTYYGDEFSGVGNVKVSGGTDSFGGFISHETGQTTDKAVGKLKSDWVKYGLYANLQGIRLDYVTRGNTARGNPEATSDWKTAGFQDILVSGTVAGASFGLNSSRSDAANSDAILARVSFPVSGFTVKLGYASMEGAYDSQDGGTLLGETIFSDGDWAHGRIAGSGSDKKNVYTGIAVAGSMGKISYQVTAGSYDDNKDSTSNSFYDITAKYSLDASTSLKIGTGKANGLSGMGMQVSYSF